MRPIGNSVLDGYLLFRVGKCFNEIPRVFESKLDLRYGEIVPDRTSFSGLTKEPLTVDGDFYFR